ncbi:MAG: hypothetical protein MJ014_08475, partial [Methanocorpusculum sp.]|nr:hypothetical protein [Methanocorpusculum sp.]
MNQVTGDACFTALKNEVYLADLAADPKCATDDFPQRFVLILDIILIQEVPNALAESRRLFIGRFAGLAVRIPRLNI